jgi:excisionase family DNA binding protein
MDLLTLREASRRMHVSRTTMFAWIRDGYIPPEMIIRLGGRIMFDAGEIESFLLRKRGEVA